MAEDVAKFAKKDVLKLKTIGGEDYKLYKKYAEKHLNDEEKLGEWWKMQCYNCNKIYNDYLGYCPYCGVKKEEFNVCSNCKEK